MAWGLSSAGCIRSHVGGARVGGPLCVPSAAASCVLVHPIAPSCGGQMRLLCHLVSPGQLLSICLGQSLYSQIWRALWLLTVPWLAHRLGIVDLWVEAAAWHSALVQGHFQFCGPYRAQGPAGGGGTAAAAVFHHRREVPTIPGLWAPGVCEVSPHPAHLPWASRVRAASCL